MLELIGTLPYNCTVGDLIELLSQVPADAKISPFGEADCAICYDPAENLAYMDNTDFLAAEFDVDFDL